MIVRLTLAALFVIPAVMAYPWQTTGERWLLGAAVAAVVILFAWWRGLFVTTIVARRIALLTGRRRGADTRSGEYTTMVLRVDGEPPYPLLAGYLDRYGISLDKVRVTHRDLGDSRSTWVSLTLGAADNIAALTARSARIPLRDTAHLAARRLADHLRELGWQVSFDESPPVLVGDDAKETWRGVSDGRGHLAAYRVAAGTLAETLDALRSVDAAEVWTAVELTGTRAHPETAAACALRTDQRPGAKAPIPGLTAERGLHRVALTALSPESDRRLSAQPAPGIPRVPELSRT